MTKKCLFPNRAPAGPTLVQKKLVAAIFAALFFGFIHHSENGHKKNVKKSNVLTCLSSSWELPM